MALEEVLMDWVSENGAPLLRFWSWKEKAVTIGRSQKIENEVDLEFCRSSNIKVIRRPSGGGAMYHAPEDEIVYSVIAPRTLFPADITSIYRNICSELVEALRKMGIKAAFTPPNSVTVSNKKVSGSAQKISSECIVQHGTVLYTPDEEEMFSVLKKNTSDDRYISSNISSVAGVKRFKDFSFSKFFERIENSFLKNREYFTQELSETELEKAQRLVKEKYEKEVWNLDP